MSLKAKLEAIIYAAETPVTLDNITQLVKQSVMAEGAADDTEVKSRVRAALEELVADYSAGSHGVEIRQVAGGYRMSTKPEHHDVVRTFAKSLKPPIRLSLPALETLAVIAYKQPVTVPEINDIRGVDSSGVIGTLLDRRLIATAGESAADLETIHARPTPAENHRRSWNRFAPQGGGTDYRWARVGQWAGRHRTRQQGRPRAGSHPGEWKTPARTGAACLPAHE